MTSRWRRVLWYAAYSVAAGVVAVAVGVLTFWWVGAAVVLVAGLFADRTPNMLAEQRRRRWVLERMRDEQRG